MISSSQQKSKKKDRFIDPNEKSIDTAFQENTLRPKSITDYVGQDNIKKHLLVSISSAKIRKEPLEHIIFYGPPGLGKTTLAGIIANEMEVNIKSSS